MLVNPLRGRGQVAGKLRRKNGKLSRSQDQIPTRSRFSVLFQIETVTYCGAFRQSGGRFPYDIPWIFIFTINGFTCRRDI